MIFSGIRSGLIPPRYGVDKETVAGIAGTLRGYIHITLQRRELAACADLTRGKLIRGGSQSHVDTRLRPIPRMNARQPNCGRARVIAIPISKTVGLQM